MATHQPSTITFAIVSPIERSDLQGLCRSVCVLLERSGASIALCDVSDANADIGTVEALARLQLIVRQAGCQMRLRHTSAELRALLAFVGLQDVLSD